MEDEEMMGKKNDLMKKKLNAWSDHELVMYG
jgi:hypothetical protein